MPKHFPPDSDDLSLKVGPLDRIGRTRKWPMYSYERPADIVWGALIQVLYEEKGWSQRHIRWWLTSRHCRWALDGSLGDGLTEAARAFARNLENPYKPKPPA